MKIVTKLLGGLAVVAITSASLAYSLDNTLLSASYMHRVANQSQLYDSLGAKLPELLSNQTQRPAATKAALEIVINPAYVEGHLRPWFEEIEAYYKANGPTPSLDLTDLADQANVYGVPLPASLQLDKPIAYQDPGLKPVVEKIVLTKVAGPILALVLLVLIAGLSHGWHRWLAPAKVLIVAAVMVGFMYAASLTLPGLLTSLVASQGQLKDLTPELTRFFTAVAAGFGTQLMQIAIGLLAAGGILVVLSVMSKLAGKFGRHGGTDVRPTPGDRSI